MIFNGLFLLSSSLDPNRGRRSVLNAIMPVVLPISYLLEARLLGQGHPVSSRS